MNRPRTVFDKLKAKFGTVLVIVGQPASIHALPLTIARDEGCQVAYLPGLAIPADCRPVSRRGENRRQGRRGDRGRGPHHAAPPALLELTDEITAELTVLKGLDQDLAAEATRMSNRIRGLLTQFHPSLERVLGLRLDHQPVTLASSNDTDPRAALRKAGRRRRVEVIRPKAPRMAQKLTDDVSDALDELTVVIPPLAASLAAVHEQRTAMEAQISHPAGDPPCTRTRS